MQLGGGGGDTKLERTTLVWMISKRRCNEGKDFRSERTALLLDSFRIELTRFFEFRYDFLFRSGRTGR